MGRGLVEPVDDHRATNPPTHPALLDALARDLVAHGFDTRQHDPDDPGLARPTVASPVRSRARPTTTASTRTRWPDPCRLTCWSMPWRASRASPSRSATCARDVGGLAGGLAGRVGAARPARPLPPGIRLRPDVAANGSLGLALHAINGPWLNAKLADPAGRLHRMVRKGRDDREIVAEFYRLALGRGPRDEELAHWRARSPRRARPGGPGQSRTSPGPCCCRPNSRGTTDALPRRARAMRRCDGILRREFLRVGGLSALGLGLADALRRRARAEAPRTALKNCILVWLDGGPSHLETFDLKPDAPAEVRGPYRPIATNVPGLAIGEHFGRLARVMDRACVIRSMTSELGEHNFGRHYLLDRVQALAGAGLPELRIGRRASRDRAYGVAVLRGRAGRLAAGRAGLPAGGVRSVRRRGRPEPPRLPHPRPGIGPRAGGPARPPPEVPGRLRSVRTQGRAGRGGGRATPTSSGPTG